MKAERNNSAIADLSRSLSSWVLSLPTLQHIWISWGGVGWKGPGVIQMHVPRDPLEGFNPAPTEAESYLSHKGLK